MTLQEMYDTAARGIIGQGGPSMLDGSCAYRGDDGRKCAAGWLIPDSAYEAEWNEVDVSGCPFFNNWSFDEYSLVEELQAAHDSAAGKVTWMPFFADWKRQMVVLAEDYNLDPSVLDEVPQ